MDGKTAPAVEGAWRLIEVANALAGLGIDDVSSLGWLGYSGGRVEVHLGSVEDVDRYADTVSAGPGELSEPGETGVRLYKRYGPGVHVFCGVREGARKVRSAGAGAELADAMWRVGGAP